MATWVWIVILIVVVIIVAALATMMARRQSSAALRQRFGPEYDRAVASSDSPRAAEAELRNRQRERRRLDIKPLSDVSRARYTGEWRAVQERFVDQPAEATDAADNLLYQVMQERGYPMTDFDAQSDLISVDHPDVVDNYRVAHDIHTRSQNQQASTEDLREALLRYRSLFRELLGTDEAARADDTAYADDTDRVDDTAYADDTTRADDAVPAAVPAPRHSAGAASPNPRRIMEADDEAR